MSHFLKQVTHFVILLLWVGPYDTQAQMNTYRSRDFEEKGVTEYLGHYGFGEIYYWTSANHERIRMEVQAMDSSTRMYHRVNFPNSRLAYEFFASQAGIHCEHPDGRKQLFKPIPRTYVSQGFEKAGLIEYIQVNHNLTFSYFTSLNPNKKIPLKQISGSYGKPQQVSFPKEDKVYELQVLEDGHGHISCKHPDGRLQIFDFYHWDGVLK